MLAARVSQQARLSQLPRSSSSAAATSSFSSSSSNSSQSTSSDWAHLPIELQLLVLSYASFGVLLSGGLVNRRLHRLILKPDVSASSPNGVWHHYPPVTFRVQESADREGVKGREVWVGNNQFTCNGEGVERLSWLLYALRRVTSLVLDFHGDDLTGRYASKELPVALFSSLHGFTQLRALELRTANYTSLDAQLAAALDSMPSLSSLKLNTHSFMPPFPSRILSRELLTAMHRLCSTQLDHITIHRRQLFHLLTHHGEAAMPRLHSLAVTPAAQFADERWRAPVSLGQFTSLSHVTVSCKVFLHQLSNDSRLPPLASLTVYGCSEADLTHVVTRTFCACWPVDDQRDNRRDNMYQSIMRAPHSVQQLALSNGNAMRTDKERTHHVFPPTAAATFSHLVYLEFLDGLTLADLAYLLDHTAPPIFASQLTHLALRVHWMERRAAATLLPSLPSMYPSLTHMHIGVWGKPQNAQVVDCAVWNEAVESVRAAVGSAWCDSTAAVVSCREDVVWRHSAGLPAEEWQSSPALSR